MCVFVYVCVYVRVGMYVSVLLCVFTPRSLDKRLDGQGVIIARDDLRQWRSSSRASPGQESRSERDLSTSKRNTSIPSILLTFLVYESPDTQVYMCLTPIRTEADTHGGEYDVYLVPNVAVGPGLR